MGSRFGLTGMERKPHGAIGTHINLGRLPVYGLRRVAQRKAPALSDASLRRRIVHLSMSLWEH